MTRARHLPLLITSLLLLWGMAPAQGRAASRSAAGAAAKKAPPGRTRAAAKPSAGKRAPGPAGSKVERAVKGIQAFYAKVRDLRSTFVQVYTTSYGTRLRSRGTFLYKKPSKIRFTYVVRRSSKGKRAVLNEHVFDGSTLWYYVGEDNLVRVKRNCRNQQLTSMASFLIGSGNLRRAFRVSATRVRGFGRPGDIVLRLIPKKPARFRKLYFAVDPRTYRIRETMYVDPGGGRNRFRWTSLRLNPGLADSVIRFKLPRGAEVETLK